MKTPSIELHYPDRAAPDLLAGILYQLVWTANRWMSLADDEVLLVEGDEDLVVATINGGQVVALEHEQIKHLSNRITARASAAYETLFAFLCSFHTLSLEKKRCTFVLTTNAGLGKQHVEPVPVADTAVDSSRLYIDLLKTWRAPDALTPKRIAELTASVKALVTSYVDRAYPPRADDTKGSKPSIDAARVRSAVEFLEAEPERWETFLRAVELRVDAGDSLKVFEELKGSIARDSRASSVDEGALAYRLLFEVMQSGAEPEVRARHLDRTLLTELIQREHAKLVEWMRSVHPERLWQLDGFNDLRQRVEQLEGGRASGVAGDELRGRHLEAVRTQNGSFRVLGIDHDIPVERAWSLSARWADQDGTNEAAFHAHRLLESPHRITMLVAEGGGGKSTVLRRIAFDAAKRDVLVLRVRAKSLAALADGEPTFAVALRRLIADLSGVTFVEAAQLEADLEVLLLDGLDEIGERADGLANECAAYAASRESVRVVMATRPSHAAVAGTPFVRANLLPLKEYEYWSAVVELLRSIGEPEESARECASRLDEILKQTTFESLPLHVTMALHLARSGEHERISLATLYERVLRSFRSRSIPERSVPEVDPVFAAQVLEAVAWYLVFGNDSGASDLVRKVIGALGSVRGIEQEARIEQALLFWEGRAILRRERVGGNERFDFAHDSLRDFVAAQRLAGLLPEDRRTWIAQCRHDAIVRFAVAWGGERVLDDVFAVDSAKSADALIRRARAAKASEPLAARFAREMAEDAATFLASNVPYSVARVLDAVLPLTVAAPEAFGAAADAALSAGEAWNVLAGWLVRLHSGAKIAEADALLELLVRWSRRGSLEVHDSVVWDLWNDLLEPALDALVRTNRSAVLDQLIETLVLGDAWISAGAQSQILARVESWGYPDLARRYQESSKLDMGWFRRIEKTVVAADCAFLVLVAATFGPASDREIDTELPNLSALLHAFDFMGATSSDWDELFFTKGARSMSVLLRGGARAAGCDEGMLAGEAEHALTMFGTHHDERSTVGLRKLGAGCPRKLDWKATSSADLSLVHVLAALRWRGAYARVAILIAAYHSDQVSVRAGIKRALEDGERFVVEVAEHLSEVLGSELTDVLASAVAKQTTETAPLLVTLAKAEPSSPRTLEFVMKALASTNGAFVDAAAEAAMSLPTTDGLSSFLRSQLERWRKWAGGEGPLEKRDFGSVEPGTTLHAKHVAKKLVKALAAHDALSYDALVLLTRDCADAALDALVAKAGREPALLKRALDDVASGALPARVAEAFFCVDGIHSEQRSRLLSFHQQANASVREAIVIGLRRCPWITEDEARRIWTVCLADGDVRVRNEAQRALDEGPVAEAARPSIISRLLRGSRAG